MASPVIVQQGQNVTVKLPIGGTFDVKRADGTVVFRVKNIDDTTFQMLSIGGIAQPPSLEAGTVPV